ncbi:RNA polymerase subunit sigma [Ferruginivarius sediminum]|uniref:RNA polymerase sigma factor n=2 Tax=Ferruginivarius sediminum TaxID=2661937 RepID=A0A369T933_9PROT|nr:RNA polymerase subunit sigma [Ferruginivarius sediminum]
MGECTDLTAEDSSNLIEEIATSGNRQAFALLFRHFAPRLKAYLRRLGAGDTLAEELAQEVMLTVWRRAAQFDRRQAGASTWIFTIARNKRIDAIRRDRWPDIDPEDPALIPEPLQAADKTVEAGQREALLRKAVTTLPVEQSTLLRLSYFEDKSHSAIAEELNLPLGTVKSRLRLALARLRTMLEDVQ